MKIGRPQHRLGSLVFAAGIFVAILLGMTPGPSALRPAMAEPVHILSTFELTTGLTGEIADDGSLVIRDGATGAQVVMGVFTPSRRHRPGEGVAFVGRSADGEENGHRGFAARADDDDDGRVDEDRLDGRDNDGDGRIDEDYAAIGDAMVATTRPDGGRAEFYHWGHAHLRTTVFAALEGVTGSWRVTSDGSDWVEVNVRALRHRVTGVSSERGAHAFVTRVEGPASPARWVGVALLDDPTRTGGGRSVLDGQALDIQLGEQPVAMAVCAADSWLGLVRALTEAQVVRDGVTDPVDGRRVPWIVVPTCSVCRGARPSDFRWRLDRSRSLVLTVDVKPGRCGLYDPDLFSLGSRPLGAPDRITWIPDEGQETSLPWSTTAPERLARDSVSPYTKLAGLDRHDATGTLEFRFRKPSAELLRILTRSADTTKLTLRSLDGRTATVELTVEPAPGDPVRSAVALAQASSGTAALVADPEAAAIAREATRQPLELSPELLRGWPNPFHDTINFRLRVPTTMGEAFVWDEAKDRPANLDLQAAVPWNAGEPRISVKVYSINGQELATLHEGSQASGEITVRWNGTDAYGRKVASGAYFCKLQLDDWSVTRRIVFVR